MVECMIQETSFARKVDSVQTVISIIIPAYNEEARLCRTLFLLEKIDPKTPFEVIVVCDGCTDRTRQIACQWSHRLPLRVLAYPENKGKGYAVRQGVLAASGQIVAFMDADGSTPPSEVFRLADTLVDCQADIVIGSRRAGGAVVTRQPVHRHLLGKLFSMAAWLILSLPYKDTQCGSKVFRRGQALDLFGDMRWDGFEFDLDILFRATKRRMKVLEVGISWNDQAGSKVSPVRDGLKMFRAMFLIRLTHWLCSPVQNGVLHPFARER